MKLDGNTGPYSWACSTGQKRALFSPVQSCRMEPGDTTGCCAGLWWQQAEMLGTVQGMTSLCSKGAKQNKAGGEEEERCPAAPCWITPGHAPLRLWADVPSADSCWLEALMLFRRSSLLLREHCLCWLVNKQADCLT